MRGAAREPGFLPPFDLHPKSKVFLAFCVVVVVDEAPGASIMSLPHTLVRKLFYKRTEQHLLFSQTGWAKQRCLLTGHKSHSKAPPVLHLGGGQGNNGALQVSTKTLQWVKPVGHVFRLGLDGESSD